MHRQATGPAVVAGQRLVGFAPNSTVNFACIPEKYSPKLLPLKSLQCVRIMRPLERDDRSEFSVTKGFGDDGQLRGFWSVGIIVT